MIGAVLTSLAGSALQAGLSNSLNREAVESQAATNDMYQRRLMRDAPSIQAAGMREAGFSPAFINGGDISTPSSNAALNAPQLSPGAFDMASLFNVEKQNEVLDAQKQKLLEEAEAQKLANRKERADQNLYSFFSSQYKTDLYASPDGVIFSKDDFDKLPDDKKMDFAPVIIPSAFSREGLDLKSGFVGKQINAQNALNDYQQALYIAKADPELINKAAKLDAQTSDNLEKTAKLLEAQTDVQKSIKALNEAMTNKTNIEKEVLSLEKEIKSWMWSKEKETSTSGLLKKIFDEGLSFESVIKLLAAMIVKNMSGGFKPW